jgi:hypothetical protein
MNSEQDIVTVRDEVFRKIGRNLLNFQKIELMLKFLVANGFISSPLSELKQVVEERQRVNNKKTMGNLVGEFTENIFPISEKPQKSTEDIKELHFSFILSVNADFNLYESKMRALKSLVDDRNDFIHHLLPRFNPESLESCIELDRYLDQQREKLIPEYEFLKSLIDLIKEHTDFLNSEEGKKQLDLSILQQSPLVALLLDVSVQKARSDGWAFLSTAGYEVRKILPGELEQLKSKWGYEKLKDLVLASELFDIAEESTEKCGSRLLFRSKPEWIAYTRLMQSVWDISNNIKTDDGWIPLSSAIQYVEISLNGELEQVMAAWSFSSLKEIMIHSDVFKIKERLENGEISVFYKQKTE